MKELARSHALLISALIALTAWTLLWEMWLAPLRGGGSWLVLKALPLAALLPGAAKARRRSLQWLALLLPFYFAEGAMRLWSEHGRGALCAAVAMVLAVAGYGTVIWYFRASRRTRA